MATNPGASLTELDSNLTAGRIPLRVDAADAVLGALLELGFRAQGTVGDTTPFDRLHDPAEAEWIRDDRGLAWLDYRGLSRALEDTLHQSLPRLTSVEVLANLRSRDVAARRLGLLQAGQLRDDQIIETILALREDPDPLVADDARTLCRELIGQRLETPQDAYHAFDATLDAHDRRQVLRWMLHEQTEPNEAIQAVVQAALIDPDWEVRASALIACARFKLLPLAEHVARCPLPTVSRLGPVKLDRDILFAIKQAVIWSFMQEPLPGEAPERLKPWRWWHIRRLVLGLPPVAEDHAFLLVHALSTPLPPAPKPATSPPGVKEISTGYLLAGTDLELAWVPPLPHWLGDENLSGNPLRLQTLPGFYIARDVIRQGETNEIMDYIKAQQRLDELSARSGAKLTLPTPSQWEAAARGPDGRRFPWGNGHESTWLWRASPWGVLRLYGESPCWCGRDGVGGGEKVVGLAKAVRAAQAGTRAALRPVVVAPEESEGRTLPAKPATARQSSRFCG